MNEINPPWVQYPGYAPGDPFWRQSGEAWFHHVWLPSWNSQSPEEKEIYLQKHNAPEIWRSFYDDDFQEWLKSID